MHHHHRTDHNRLFLALTLAVPLLLAPLSAIQARENPFDTLKNLEKEFDAAVAAGDYGKALEIGGQAHLLILDKHVAALVGMAGAHVKLGETDKALARLREAAETSFWHTHHALADNDAFKGIREKKRFKTMMRGAWMKNYIAMLDRPERADFQKPLEVMAALAIEPGERVADIGAGSGYFSIPIAKAVGPSGKVWATDLHQELIDHMTKRASEEELDNVEALMVAKDDPMLPAGCVDTILLVDAYHYLEDRVAYIRKMRCCLAPGGRIVVIDSIPRPPEERMPGYPQPHVQISREMLDAEMREAGLVPVKVHDFLPEQYFVEYSFKDSDG